jgi:hypothetical protein
MRRSAVGEAAQGGEESGLASEQSMRPEERRGVGACWRAVDAAGGKGRLGSPLR